MYNYLVNVYCSIHTLDLYICLVVDNRKQLRHSFPTNYSPHKLTFFHFIHSNLAILSQQNTISHLYLIYLKYQHNYKAITGHKLWLCVQLYIRFV